jgi:curved DNA-binding protein CbpA
MQTLYDTIGARPGDGAENIKRAYRQAAKANHPDHHAGDPGAALRFRQITAAYAVLRDGERRAAYDRLLEYRRKPLRTKLKRTVSEVRRHVVYDTVVATVITAILFGAYALVSRISAGTADVTAPEPVLTIAVARADRSANASRNRMSAPQMPIVVPITAGVDASAVSVANDRPPEEQRGESVPSEADLAVTTAVKDAIPPRDDDSSDGSIDRSSASAAASDPESNPQPEPLEQKKTPSVEALNSGAEKHSGRRRAIWSRAAWTHAAASRDRHDGRINDSSTSDAAMVNVGPQAAVIRRPAGGHPAVEQAALEHRNSPAADIPPLFGVGF